MTISRTVVGVDTAKRVFQLYWVDMETGEIVDLRLTRTKFLEHFANRAPCLVALEACGGSQHWGRRLRELGHEVRLLSAKMVRPFVGGNKNDAHDARAIWTAVQQPGIKTVAIKTEEQQAILALHRMRQQLVKFRTAQINCLRGLLTEYGEVMPKGRAGMRRGMAEALARVSERLPAMVVEALREQWARVSRLDEEIGEIERRLKLWHRDNVASRRIAAIPGVGVLTATAAVAMMGDPRRIPVRPGVCRLARSGAAPQRHRRAGTHARHLQAWGHLPAYPADPRRPLRTHHEQIAAGMGLMPGRAAAGERGRRRTGQQDRTHDLGLAGPRPNVPAELRQPARLGKTGTEITYHQEEVSRQEVAQGTTKCDGEQVRPRSAKPEQAQGQEAQWENEARIG